MPREIMSQPGRKITGFGRQTPLPLPALVNPAVVNLTARVLQPKGPVKGPAKGPVKGPVKGPAKALAKIIVKKPIKVPVVSRSMKIPAKSLVTAAADETGLTEVSDETDLPQVANEMDLPQVTDLPQVADVLNGSLVPEIDDFSESALLLDLARKNREPTEPTGAVDTEKINKREERLRQAAEVRQQRKLQIQSKQLQQIESTSGMKIKII